jgi:hypothetical protein
MERQQPPRGHKQKTQHMKKFLFIACILLAVTVVAQINWSDSLSKSTFFIKAEVNPTWNKLDIIIKDLDTIKTILRKR